MSRSTRCARTVEPDGVYWRWGHLYVSRKEDKHGVHITPGESEGNGNQRGHARLTPEHANVLSDLLRAAYVDAGGSACGGKSILELLWDELDTVMERLMTGQAAEDGRDPGRAEGVAYALAVMQNPYLPNIDSVREQAMERWEAQDHAPAPSPAERRAARRARRG